MSRAAPHPLSRPGWRLLAEATVRRLYWIYLFGRLSVLGFTLLVALVGGIAAVAAPSPGELAGLLLVGLSFHLFAYVSNDVADLWLDRSEPLRHDSPLVVSPRNRRPALAFALAQAAPAALGAAWLGAGAASWLALGAAFALMGVYNRWGKRCGWPVLTDLAQGVSWASLALFGASLGGDRPSPASLWVAVYLTIYILMINGVHGGLRDLRNDRRRGARTTAIWLGARPGEGPGEGPGRRLLIWAASLELGLLASSLGPLAAGAFGYPAGGRLLCGALVLGLHGAGIGAVWRALGQDGAGALLRAGLLHMLTAMAVPAALLAPRMSLPAGLAAALCLLAVALCLGLYQRSENRLLRRQLGSERGAG